MSDSISRIASPALKASPSLLNHRVIAPSVMRGDIAGIIIALRITRDVWKDLFVVCSIAGTLELAVGLLTLIEREIEAVLIDRAVMTGR